MGWNFSKNGVWVEFQIASPNTEKRAVRGGHNAVRLAPLLPEAPQPHTAQEPTEEAAWPRAAGLRPVLSELCAFLPWKECRPEHIITQEKLRKLLMLRDFKKISLKGLKRSAWSEDTSFCNYFRKTRKLETNSFLKFTCNIFHFILNLPFPHISFYSVFTFTPVFRFDICPHFADTYIYSLFFLVSLLLIMCKIKLPP